LTYNNIRKKKVNRWSQRVQLYLPLGKDRKWERERLKGFKKKRKGKTEIKERLRQQRDEEIEGEVCNITILI
jgi:hypothetical protein